MVANNWCVLSLLGSCGGSLVSFAWFVVGEVGWDRVLRMFFSCLVHVSFCRCFGLWVMFVDGLWGEAWPRVEESALDGL